jgi:putative tryptophan/tyrosine transport system substrate-binding protein
VALRQPFQSARFYRYDAPHLSLGLEMKRRDFLGLLGGTAAAWPVIARAQQAMPVIGYLYSGAPETSANALAAFRDGLSEAGYVEGRNLTIEYRWAYNDNARLPELAADLVRHRVAVIATPGTPASVLAAKAATTRIPIVFRTGADPVQLGLVASLARPGGNLTGVTPMSGELGPKRLGLLTELLPGASRLALLGNPDDPTFEPFTRDAQAAVTAIRRQIEVLTARTNREIDTAFADLARRRLDAVLIGAHGLFNNRRVQLVTLATRYAVPAIYPIREFTEIGGLMSYGANQADQFRHTGIYVGRILKGEKPADLPILRATKLEFIINLQTAKTLGLEVPPTLLARADEVIE